MTLSKTISLASAALTLSLAVPVAASAQSSSALSGLFACEAIASDSAQLACFRAETAKLRPAQPVLRSAPAPIVQSPAPARTESVAAIVPEPAPHVVVQPVPQVMVGKRPKVKSRKAGKRSVGIRTAKAYGAKGYYVFTLENGEVWQQVTRAKVRVGKGSKPDVLDLAPATMGSYFARVNGKSPAIRVKRIR